MKFIDLFEEQFRIHTKTGTIREKEEIAVNFIKGIKWRENPELTKLATQYVSHILNDYVAKDEPITILESKMIHCLLTTISLSELGLDNINVIYRDKTASDQNAGAYYRDYDKSITFFNNNVCNKGEFLVKYSKEDAERGAKNRLDYFVGQVHALEHEIQHAIQYRQLDMIRSRGTDITPESYIISLQEAARDLSRTSNSKYQKNNIIEELYNKNHDQFYYELDADRGGIERMLNRMSDICSKAFEVAAQTRSGDTYLKKLSDKVEKLENYKTSTTWRHDTNPNNDVVLATHKASLIIDHVVKNHNKSSIFNEFPALLIVYNKNGTKKSLDQVEKEKLDKINQILLKGTDDEVREQATNIMKLYDTAIECDAVLSLEKCLQHIARLTWGSDRYFTNNGYEVKYDPKHIRGEVASAKAKAMTIVGYLEDVDGKIVKSLFKKYYNELLNTKINNNLSRRFVEDKKLAFMEIEQEFRCNKEVQEQIKKDEKDYLKKYNEKKTNIEKLTETIKKVFPNFTPNPQTYVINENKFVDNVDEKLMLNEAYRQYVSMVMRNPELKNSFDFVPTTELRTAIEGLYPFQLTGAQLVKFNSDYRNGKVEMIHNVFDMPKPIIEEPVQTDVEKDQIIIEDTPPALVETDDIEIEK